MKYIAAVLLIALVAVACQTVTVQLGDSPSADRAAGVRSVPSVTKDSSTTTTTIHNPDPDKEQKK
jgi:hypothetical protein